MENGIGAELAGQLCHLGNGHHGTCLVIHHHNGHQHGIGPQSGFQVGGLNSAFAVRLQIGHFVALKLQILHAVKNRGMFHGGGNDVLILLAETADGAVNGPVVRFRTAGGEENPVRLSAQSGGNFMPGFPEQFGGIEAEAVQGAGVGPVFR